MCRGHFFRESKKWIPKLLLFKLLSNANADKNMLHFWMSNSGRGFLNMIFSMSFHDFDSTHSQYSIMNTNKKTCMHGRCDQEKLSAREQTMKPRHSIILAENLKKDITRPLICTCTCKICSILWVLMFHQVFFPSGRDSSFYCDSFLYAVVLTSVWQESQFTVESRSHVFKFWV